MSPVLILGFWGVEWLLMAMRNAGGAGCLIRRPPSWIQRNLQHAHDLPLVSGPVKNPPGYS